MDDTEFTYINFRVTRAMKKGIDEVAKEYNVTISEMMRILVVGVLPDKEDSIDASEPTTRQYQRRKVD